MPHKLLIECVLEHREELEKYLEARYREYYSDYIRPECELIRGVPFRIKLKITNIGEKKFPGGEITKLELSVGLEGSVVISASLRQKPKVEPLDKGKSKSYKFPFMSINSGAGVIRLEISAKDGKQVLYSRHRVEEPSSSWEKPVYCIEREYVEIINLLKSLRTGMRK